MTTREEANLARATAALLRAVPAAQRQAMLDYSAQSIRSTLVHTRTDLSSREIDARVQAHIAAVRACLEAGERH
jgi:hypothetical protein